MSDLAVSREKIGSLDFREQRDQARELLDEAMDALRECRDSIREERNISTRVVDALRAKVERQKRLPDAPSTTRRRRYKMKWGWLDKHDDTEFVEVQVCSIRGLLSRIDDLESAYRGAVAENEDLKGVIRDMEGRPYARLFDAVSNDAYKVAKYIVFWLPNLEDGNPWPEEVDRHPILLAARRIIQEVDESE